LLLLLTASTTTHTALAYYLSLNHLEFKNASRFCRSHCNSELASIHSVEQHYAALAAIATSRYVSEDVWIGLSDIAQSDVWRWSDGSPSDFGLLTDSSNLVIRSQFPWRSGEPDIANSDDAVAIEASRALEWSDREQFANSHLLCASCDGRLSKFVAINGYRTQSEAELFCRAAFGTSLASIHSARDLSEAQSACRGVTDGRGCWLGLSDARLRRQYEWSDGTEWRFGRGLGASPWIDAQPGAVDDDKCVQMDPPLYLWNDDHCNATARTLCNAPSLVCDAPLWLDLSDDADTAATSTPSATFTTAPCALSLTAETSRLLMPFRRWRNGDEALVIDAMMAMTPRDVDGSAGLTLHLDAARCGSYYYVGIWPAHSFVFIGKFAEGAQWTLLETAEIWGDAAQSYFVAYALRVEQTHNRFDVFVNEVLLISVADNEFGGTAAMNALGDDDDGLSGFVGVRAVNVSVRVSSLFVSGSVEDDVDDDALWNSCRNISTTAPTASPTRAEVTSRTSAPTTSDGGDVSDADGDEGEAPRVTGAPTSPTSPTQSREVRSREPSMSPTVVQTTTTSTTTTSDGSDVDGDDGEVPVDEGQELGANLNSETMLWLIGIPAGAIMICLMLSCVVNLYFCKKELVETYDSDEEGDDSSEMDDTVGSDTEDLETDAYDYDI